MELSTAYNPKEAEQSHYKRWEESGYFAPEINQIPESETYSIVIPPPNITGSLHMGHALQHTIMDILVRRKRMLGYRTLFLPGIDHAGISTQLMVTRELKEKENKTPQEIGREAFTKKAWEWKRKFGGTILEQIRREGISVDWSRERFTMDEELSMAVTNVFVSLFEEGSIYRGARIVNWCPNDKTVLSDLEVEDLEKKDGKLYYLKYPLAGGGGSSADHGAADVETTKYLTVATTRPETMLGDTAVAVNPDDDRFREYVGREVELPLTGRTIPIITDKYVDPEFGTGAVKITPSHDPNDYEMGLRHNLPELNVMNPDGTMNDASGKDFAGLDRFEARKKVIAKFQELGLLERIDDYEIVLPVCERCKTVIETLVSEQWWVNMSEMRDMALDLKRKTDYPRFSPETPHTKIYTEWLENLRDWTISRQLWWGHQIPAWYDNSGNIFVARTKEDAIALAGTGDLRQDEDVLDTWFSSWLWSFSTLGWTGKAAVRGIGTTVQRQENPEADNSAQNSRGANDLEVFHPTNVLVTARDIIFLWVSRMVMSSLKFVGERPFDDVYITGTVLAQDGQRMSKTKGNGVDPIEVFDKYGVDATRITLAGSSTGMDFAWRDEKVESYRNFANKIWNATRFCLMNAGDAKIDPKSITSEQPTATGGEKAMLPQNKVADRGVGGEFSLADRWIIARLNKTAIDVNNSLDRYAFHEAVQLLYHFFWDDFCDWYIELVKDEISVGSGRPASESEGGEETLRSEARTRILSILDQALRLLHPFMPYLTEELWLKLPGAGSSLHHPAYRSAQGTIMLADFPTGNPELIDHHAESQMALVIELITKIRNIRAEMRIKSSEFFDVHIGADVSSCGVFNDNKAQILKLARAGTLTLGEKISVPKASAKSVLTNGSEIAIPLEGLIDFDLEIERLEGQINKLLKEDEKLQLQLSNDKFVNKAPAEKVAAVRNRSAEIEVQISALRENLELLQ